MTTSNEFAGDRSQDKKKPRADYLEILEEGRRVGRARKKPSQLATRFFDSVDCWLAEPSASQDEDQRAA